MELKNIQLLELLPSADMHVHLRQDQVSVTILYRPDRTNGFPQMMELVVPQIRRGGVDTVFVMARRPVYTYGLSLIKIVDSQIYSLLYMM